MGGGESIATTVWDCVHAWMFGTRVGMPVLWYAASRDRSVRRSGPHSWKRPKSEDAPGPPLYLERERGDGGGEGGGGEGGMFVRPLHIHTQHHILSRAAHDLFVPYQHRIVRRVALRLYHEVVEVHLPLAARRDAGIDVAAVREKEGMKE